MSGALAVSAAAAPCCSGRHHQAQASVAPCGLKPRRAPFLGDTGRLRAQPAASSSGRQAALSVSSVAAPEGKQKPQTYGNGKVVKVRRLPPPPSRRLPRLCSGLLDATTHHAVPKGSPKRTHWQLAAAAAACQGARRARRLRAGRPPFPRRHTPPALALAHPRPAGAARARAQLLHHRPHRPRQVHAGRPAADQDRHGGEPRHAGGRCGCWAAARCGWAPSGAKAEAAERYVQAGTVGGQPWLAVGGRHASHAP